MRSLVSADALGVLGCPGAQKKCLGLVGDCAWAAELANANSKATTKWVLICDLPCRVKARRPPRCNPTVRAVQQPALPARDGSSTTTKMSTGAEQEFDPGSNAPTMRLGVTPTGLGEGAASHSNKPTAGYVFNTARAVTRELGKRVMGKGSRLLKAASTLRLHSIWMARAATEALHHVGFNVPRSCR